MTDESRDARTPEQAHAETVAALTRPSKRLPVDLAVLGGGKLRRQIPEGRVDGPHLRPRPGQYEPWQIRRWL